jgi:hypothetical protein
MRQKRILVSLSASHVPPMVLLMRKPPREDRVNELQWLRGSRPPQMQSRPHRSPIHSVSLYLARKAGAGKASCL